MPPVSHVGSQVGSQVEPRRPTPARPRTWVDRALDPARWDERHARLATQPVFRRCSRSEIRRLATAGDECFVPAQTVLCREGRIGYWFFVVTSGTVRLSQRGRALAVLGPGSHFGELAILGFGPQPMTATVEEDATVYILGRRSVLDLSGTMRSLQLGLFGTDVAANDVRVRVRELRLEGMAAWDLIPRRTAAELAAAARIEQLPPSVRTLPTRRAPTSLVSPFAAALSPVRSTVAVAENVRQAIDVRWVAAVAGVVVAAAVLFALLFHPDVLVVRPGARIDVTADVTVSGQVVRVHPPRARYLVTAVRIEQPSIVGLGLSRLRGEPTIARARGDEAVADRRAGRDAYRESERVATAVVATRLGIAPGTLDVRFRDRGLSGPSAGLVYALVLADMTDQLRPVPGRVVAATGDLDRDGSVGPVGFVAEKRVVARRAGATVFLVPTSSFGVAAGGDRRPAVIRVARFDDALRALDVRAGR